MIIRFIPINVLMEIIGTLELNCVVSLNVPERAIRKKPGFEHGYSNWHFQSRLHPTLTVCGIIIPPNPNNVAWSRDRWEVKLVSEIKSAKGFCSKCCGAIQPDTKADPATLRPRLISVLNEVRNADPHI